jgi:hypothetical protein
MMTFLREPIPNNSVGWNPLEKGHGGMMLSWFFFLGFLVAAVGIMAVLSWWAARGGKR